MIVWKLDALLRERGVKGRELARRLAIGENYLSRVRHEVPDRLSLSLLDALCRELSCTLDELIEYRPDKPKAARKPRAPKAAPAPVVTTDEPPPPAAGPVELDEELQTTLAQVLAAMDEDEPPAPMPEAAEVAAAIAGTDEPPPPVAAPQAPEAEAPPPATGGGAALQLRGNALQARLERLRRARGN